MRITEGYYLIIYALFVMVLMMFCPSGIIGFFERVHGMMRRRATSHLAEAQTP
jgi:branched-chain amino acid transport system permease protein